MSNYMVGNAPAPASYAGRLLDFSNIAQWPRQYYAGQEMARQQEMADYFRDRPIPTDPNTGQVDVNALISAGAHIGGLPYLQGLLPFMYGAQAGQGAAATMQGLDPMAGLPQQQREAAEPGPDTHNPAAAGPANIRPPPPPSQQPIGRNVNEIVSRLGGNPDDPKWQGIAGRLGVKDTEADLPADKALRLENAIRATTGTQANQRVAGGFQTLPPTAASEAGVPPPTPAPSGVAGAPGPIASPPERLPEIQVRPPTERPPSMEQPEPKAPGVPAGVSNDEMARRYDIAANRARAVASAYASNPYTKGQAEQFDKAAADYAAKRDKIREFQAKYQAIEPEETTKLAIKEGGALENSLRTAADQYTRIQQPYVEGLKGLINNPDIYTGFGAGWVQGVNRLRAALGGKVGPAMAAEAMEKFTAASILAQTNQMKAESVESGSTSGRVFGAQIDQMMKASPRLEGTPAGIRFLMEMQSRMGERAKFLSNLAQRYTDPNDRQYGGHRYLDRGFNRLADKLMPEIFRKEELAYPQLIGAAEMPTARSGPKAAAQWVREMKLGADEPVRIPNGKYLKAGDILRLDVPVAYGR